MLVNNKMTDKSLILFQVLFDKSLNLESLSKSLTHKIISTTASELTQSLPLLGT